MSTNAEKWTFNIIGGPSRDRIFDACKYAYDNDRISIDFKIVVFETESGCDLFNPVLLHMADVVIDSIEHKNRSKSDFILGGKCKADLGFDLNGKNPDAYYIRTSLNNYGRIPHPEIRDYWREYEFEIKYDTNSRRGKITFSEK